jgi:hypothetical protein
MVTQRDRNLGIACVLETIGSCISIGAAVRASINSRLAGTVLVETPGFRGVLARSVS